MLTLASLLAALAATWPLVLHPAGTVPWGTEFAATPTVHDLWTLWWVAERAAHGFADFWNAPIFRPQTGAFAYSDPLILPGLVSSPFWWSGLPPAICYNVALIAVLTLNGVCAGRLVRALGGSRSAAALGAVFATTLPLAAKMAGVLTALPFFGLLLSVEGSVRFGSRGGRGAAGLAALGFLVQCLASQQYALLGLPFMLMAAVAALAGQGFSGASLRRFAAASALAGGLALAVLFPAIREHRSPGFRRSESAVSVGSARAADFLTRPFTSPFSLPPRESPDRDTGGLFPGLFLLSLGAAGAVDGLRSRRRWTLVLVASAAVAAVLALGTNADLWGWRPFVSLRAVVPGLDAVRSPFRSAVIVQAILAVLAGLGLDAAAGRSRRPAWRAVLLCLAALAATENLCLPARLLPVPGSPRTTWTSWLRSQPPGTTVVAHVPFPAGDDTAAFAVETWRMFRQIDHRQPLVNGYAAYFPPLYDALQRLVTEESLSYRSLCALHELAGADTLVVDRGWLENNRSQVARPEIRGLLRPAHSDDEVTIFRLALAASDCRPTGDSGEP